MNLKRSWQIFIFVTIVTGPLAVRSQGRAPQVTDDSLTNLTNGLHEPEPTDFADPSAPDLHDPRFVKIYLTAGEVLTWRRPAAGANLPIASLMRQQAPIHERLSFCHSDGSPFNPEAGEDVWDPTLNLDLESGQTEIIYGGAMTPAPGHSFAVWPDDNWSRRTTAFLFNGLCWVMQPAPLWGERPTDDTWIGHNYGHDFVKDASGATYVFYERVTDDSNDLPWKTEIFARKMLNSLKADDTEIPILAIPQRGWPAATRASGGQLVEGPRVFRVANKYLLSFSAGEYASPRYGIHLLWSEKMEGPYHPYLSRQHNDLFDFAAEVKASLPMTWGAARANFFESDGHWWALFHGIESSSYDESKDGHRSLFLAPVSIDASRAGAPTVRVRSTAN